MFRKMWQMITDQKVHGSGRGKRSPKQRRKAWTTRPRLEMLENRLAPAVITVTNLSDAVSPPSGVDLRQAIALADLPANAGSTINFATGLNGTVIMQQGSYKITQPMKIDATGHTIAVDGGAKTRDFYITTPGTVSFINLTIKNGKVSASEPDGASGNGGGIDDTSATSILVLTNDHILINKTNGAGNGGGVYSNGIVRVTGTTIDGNTALGGNGGGIYALKSMNFTNSTISNNRALVGGGVYQGGTGTTV